MTTPIHPLARKAKRLVLIGEVVILACAALCALAAGDIAYRYTRPAAPKGTPPHA